MHGFLHNLEFWPKATLASSPGRLGGVSVQTWTPTLILASSDVDANFSDLHAQQSCKLLKQGMATIGGMSPNGSEAPSNPTPLELDLEIYCDKKEAGAKERASPSSPCCGAHPRTRRKPWLPVDDVEVCQLTMTSRGVRSGRSSRPRPHRVLYFPHHRQWTMEYSCKVWCKPCRRRPTPRQHSRPSWRPRRELMYGGPPYYVHTSRTER
ncbi:hypothetical protein Taro_005064 [Colocasia esculenta]|uniref:Uncharacterized protein n=1 Tax=Colocasia esculenta TaxID=4460 RepID=A0A843TRZ1_COLES|nr:hypothetical protein [Colocasia esculenta]